MNDSLLGQAAPDFNDPLGLLRACHERMLAQCNVLERLPAHIAAKGADDEARSAIRAAVQYFTTSARHHHQDEEQDLFPILNRQSLKLADRVYTLKQEHARLEAAWDALANAFKKSGELAGNSEFPSLIENFCALYRAHIEFENREILSIAQHILSQRQLEDMGDAMARRRGVRRLPAGG